MVVLMVVVVVKNQSSNQSKHRCSLKPSPQDAFRSRKCRSALSRRQKLELKGEKEPRDSPAKMCCGPC